jgi:hypothetical protein
MLYESRRVMKDCEHKETEYIPQEREFNVKEDLICLDCGESLPLNKGEQNG